MGRPPNFGARCTLARSRYQSVMRHLLNNLPFRAYETGIQTPVHSMVMQAQLSSLYEAEMGFPGWACRHHP